MDSNKEKTNKMEVSFTLSPGTMEVIQFKADEDKTTLNRALEVIVQQWNCENDDEPISLLDDWGEIQKMIDKLETIKHLSENLSTQLEHELNWD